MKNICIIIFLLASCMVSAQERKTYYEILDAAEANKLYHALKTDSTHTPGWPIPTTAVEGKFLPSRDYLEIIETERQEIDANNTLVKARISAIKLYQQGLKGIVPAVKLDSLRELTLSFNKITGISPELTLNKLNWLALAYCNLKTFPKNKFPALTLLELSNNGMEGAFPSELNALTPNLQSLDGEENKFTGNLVLNHPKLVSLSLDDNLLTGTLNRIDLPNLTYLNVSQNNMEGMLQLNTLPILRLLDIDGNKFKDVSPDFKTTLPSLQYLYASNNNFHFDDLLPLLSNGYEIFSYGLQSYVLLKIEPSNNKQKLMAEVGGEGNQYDWFYVHPTSALRKISEDTIPLYLGLYISFGFNDTSLFRQLPGENKNYLEIANTENPIYYGCRVSNPMLPKLKIAAIHLIPKPTKCWENQYFTVCLEDEGASWSSGEEDNEITSSGLMSINDFLIFEGSLTIDTAILKINSKGKYFLKDIPIPGGGIGNFTLAEGEYELGLGGENGKITGFINDQLGTYTPDIGGLEIKLEDLSLVGGRNAIGVNLSFSVEWDNITPSCGDNKEQTSAIKISGLNISSEGISVEGMEVADLGLAPGFCLKELKASYESEEDKMAFALTILTPFIEVGGGLEFIAGELETIEMKAELQNSIIPIATTGIGIIGCEGKISKITNPPFNLKFGGIFSAVANDHLFRLTTSVEFIPPSELKLAAGDGKFFNPPIFDSDWWLAEGGIYGSLDLKSYRLKMGGNIKMAPYKNDEDEKAFMTEGSIDMALRKDPIGMVFTGQFKGAVTIPELGEEWPYDWLNAKLGLPYDIDGEALLVYKPTAKFISGDVNLGGRIGEVHYDINLNKRYDEEGFFSFIVREGDLTTAPRSKNRIIQVPPQTRLAVIKARGITALPIVEMTAPGGQIINEINPGSMAELNKLISKQKVFWTLYQPQAGNWTISTVNEDSLEVYFIPYNYELKFKAQDKGSFVDLTWNNQDFQYTDSIEFYVDDDSTGFNGIYVGSATASQSGYALGYNQAEGLCSFYVYALAYKGGLIKSVYALNSFSNPTNNFPAPTGLTMTYDPVTGILIAKWTPAAEADLAGYVIGLANNTNNQVLHMLYGSENTYRDTLPGLNNPVVYIQSYGNHGQVSCPVSAQKSVATREWKPKEISSPINVFPNPNTGRITMKLTNDYRITSPVYIYDLLGRMVKMIPANEFSAPVQSFEINLNELAEGSYFITGFIGQNRFNKKIVVVDK